MILQIAFGTENLVAFWTGKSESRVAAPFVLRQLVPRLERLGVAAILIFRAKIRCVGGVSVQEVIVSSLEILEICRTIRTLVDSLSRLCLSMISDFLFARELFGTKFTMQLFVKLLFR